MDYSNVRAVCFNCARKAGFVQIKKAVIAFEDDCDICKARRPCTDLHHDWIPPEKESRGEGMKTTNDVLDPFERLAREVENDAARDCVYNHEDLQELAERIRTTAALARSTIPNAEQFVQQAECARHGVVTATVYRVLTPEGVCVAEFTDAVRACDYGDVLRSRACRTET